jgi:superfamily II DNA or RNA helicase
LIAARRTNTLVLVHRAQLLDQWRERLAAFLNLSIDSIGQIGAGKKKTGTVSDQHRNYGFYCVVLPEAA